MTLDVDEYDVAVIGYGPTGATAANILGGLGLRVVVIERDPDVYGRARAISTDEEVMRIWQQVGLADRLQADMLPGGVIAFIGADGKPFLETEIVERGAGYPAQQMLYQPAVDAVLREGVARFRNVEVLTQYESIGVSQSPDHAEVAIKNVETGATRRIRAAYVIAADGGSSCTRKQLGIGYRGRTYAQRWVVIDTKVLTRWEGDDRLRLHCNPDRPTVDCPTPLGHHRWEFPVDADEHDEQLLADAAIWKVLNSQGVTPEHVEILRAVVYSHHVRVADRWRVGRVFVAGDAAHAMPPWLGQGMAAGVRDVSNLCWKLDAVLKGSLPQTILDSYQAERMPHVREVTNRSVKVGRLVTERHRLLAVARDRACRVMAHIPGALSRFAERRWIPQAHYTAGLLAAIKHPALGHLPPQPWIVDYSGASVRLDDAIGQRWTILTLESSTHPRWESAGVPVVRIVTERTGLGDDALLDVSGDLTRWLRAHEAHSLVLRPDGFVYGAAKAGQTLPQPPDGFARVQKSLMPNTFH